MKSLPKDSKPDFDITTCYSCGEPIYTELVTGEPQTCGRVKCVKTLFPDFERDNPTPDSKQEWEGAFNEKFHKIEVFYDVVANAPYPMIMPKDRHENDEYGLEDIKSFIRQTLSLQKQQIVEDERQRIKQWVKEQEPNYMSLDKTETDSFYIDSGELLKAISPLEVK